MSFTEAEAKVMIDRLAKWTGKRPIVAKRKKPPERSKLEIQMDYLIELAQLPAPEREALYLVGSRHRLDFCWRDRRIGLEVQGMPHRIKGRFKADLAKRAAGLLQGWHILEVGADEIRNGQAIVWLEQLLSAK